MVGSVLALLVGSAQMHRVDAECCRTGMGGSTQCSLQCPPAAQASIVAALSSDLGKVAQLVEQAGEALASDPAASVQVRM